MNVFNEIIHNKFVVVPVVVWFCIQLFKVISELVVKKKFNFKRILGAGGMPSSHTAIVVTLTVMIGKEIGFNSPLFAVSLIFSLIIMYDAAGVRRAAGKQASLLNKIMDTPGLTNIEMQERLVEVLGHTPVQVFVGALIGIIVGAIFG